MANTYPAARLGPSIDTGFSYLYHRSCFYRRRAYHKVKQIAREALCCLCRATTLNRAPPPLPKEEKFYNK